jgi:hypothetical protein
MPAGRVGATGLRDRRGALAAGLMLGSLVTASRAGAESQTIRFTYDAPAGCPDQAAFVRLVQARAEHFRLARPEESATTFAVHVSSNASASSAEVDMIGSKFEPLRRSVQGAGCEEVVEAIALVTAMAIEARAAADAPAREPAQPASPSVGSFEAVPPRESAARPPAPRPSRDDRGWGAGIMVGVSALQEIGNPLALGLYGERMGTIPFRSLRWSVARASASATRSGRDASFEWWTTGLALCPFGWQPTPGLELQACVGGDGGWLTGKGQLSEPLPAPATSTIFWAEASSAIHLRWTLENFLVFEAAGEVGLPLVRHRFYFAQPSEDVFKVPVARLGTTLSGGLRF